MLSNEPEMLETLSKQAGVTHVSRANSKSVNRHHDFFGQRTTPDTSLTIQTSEEPLFSVNKLSRFTLGEALVTTVERSNNSGEATRPMPIYDTRETVMPMAWRLHKNGSNNSQFKHALANVKTISTTRGLNPSANIPDFDEIYNHRLNQAMVTAKIRHDYMDVHGYKDQDMRMLNKEVLSEELMRQINDRLNPSAAQQRQNEDRAEALLEQAGRSMESMEAETDKEVGKYSEDGLDFVAELAPDDVEMQLFDEGADELPDDFDDDAGSSKDTVGAAVEDHLKKSINTVQDIGTIDPELNDFLSGDAGQTIGEFGRDAGTSVQQEAYAAQGQQQQAEQRQIDGMYVGNLKAGGFASELNDALTALNLRSSSDMSRSGGWQFVSADTGLELRTTAGVVMATAHAANGTVPDWSIIDENQFMAYLLADDSHWEIDRSGQFLKQFEHALNEQDDLTNVKTWTGSAA